MQVKWDEFLISISVVLDTAYQALQLVSNTNGEPCLYNAIKSIQSTHFFRSHIPPYLLENYDEEWTAEKKQAYESSYRWLLTTMRTFVEKNACSVENFSFEDSAESVKTRCQQLLDAKLLPFDPSFVKRFESDESLPRDAYIFTEPTLTLRTILSWPNDEEYTKRLNAHGLEEQIKIRHPLEKFLAQLCTAIESRDHDIRSDSRLYLHRFTNLESFIYYFRERFNAEFHTPLQDVITMGETVLQYVTLLLDVASQVGLPSEIFRTIDSKRSALKLWYRENFALNTLHDIAIKQVSQANLKTTELHDLLLCNFPESMETLQRKVSDFLVRCYPLFSRSRVSNDELREILIARYEVYRESYFDVASQLKEMLVRIRVEVGNDSCGLVKYFVQFNSITNQAHGGASPRRELTRSAGHLSPNLRTKIATAKPESAGRGRKSGSNFDLDSSIMSAKPGADKRLSKVNEKDRSRSLGDKNSPRSLSVLSPDVAGSPRKVDEERKVPIMGAITGFFGKKKPDAPPPPISLSPRSPPPVKGTRSESQSEELSGEVSAPVSEGATPRDKDSASEGSSNSSNTISLSASLDGATFN